MMAIRGAVAIGLLGVLEDGKRIEVFKFQMVNSSGLASDCNRVW